jgi:hypothetical protein
MIYLIISLSVFWIFFIGSYRLVGIHRSISDLFYILRTKGLGWSFRLFIAGISLPMIIYLNDYSVPLTFSGLFILLVAFTANTKKRPKRSWNHVIGATGGILLGFAGLILKVTWVTWYKDLFFWSVVLFLALAVIIMPIGCCKQGVKNHTTWIETMAFNIIILTLIINECVTYLTVDHP